MGLAAPEAGDVPTDGVPTDVVVGAPLAPLLELPQPLRIAATAAAVTAADAKDWRRLARIVYRLGMPMV